MCRVTSLRITDSTMLNQSMVQKQDVIPLLTRPEQSWNRSDLLERIFQEPHFFWQTPKHDIRFMILIPTCSCCNHAGQAAKSQTNFPPTSEDAHILYTVTGARIIFIDVSAQTISNKGKGKGTGEGGGYKADYPPQASNRSTYSPRNAWNEKLCHLTYKYGSEKPRQCFHFKRRLKNNASLACDCINRKPASVGTR